MGHPTNRSNFCIFYIVFVEFDVLTVPYDFLLPVKQNKKLK